MERKKQMTYPSRAFRTWIIKPINLKGQLVAVQIESMALQLVASAIYNV
jgi:hypothetical protein